MELNDRTATGKARGVMLLREGNDIAFLRRVLITLGVLALALLAWQVRYALLLAFAGVVFAVMLLALARPLEAKLGLSRGWSLAAVGTGLAAMFAMTSVLVGSEVVAQVALLIERLPEAIADIENALGQKLDLPGNQDGGQGRSNGWDSSWLGSIASHVASIGSAIVSALSVVVVAVIGGWFIAADPSLYRHGVAMLMPRSQRGRAEEAMSASGEALRLWLGAQLVSMILIGLLAGVGTWVIGLPSPVALGLFAGLVAFVPLVGSVAGAVPALLLALAEGSSSLLWTAGLFLVIQQVESNMVAPAVQKRLVSLPPALVLFAIVGIGMLFGIAGLILAAPITVVCFVLVKLLYVSEMLGEDTHIPGQDKEEETKDEESKEEAA